MTLVTLCEGVSGMEAAEAVANSLREKDHQREEWLAKQKSINQSVSLEDDDVKQEVAKYVLEQTKGFDENI